MTTPWYIPAVGRRVKLQEPALDLFEKYGLVPGSKGTVTRVLESPTEYLVAWDGVDGEPVLHGQFEIAVEATA